MNSFLFHNRSISEEIYGAERQYGSMAVAVIHNLREQHGWLNLKLVPTNSHKITRPLVLGLPPQLLYIHPDDQKKAISDGSIFNGPPIHPTYECIFCMHAAEFISAETFIDIFDVRAESTSHLSEYKTQCSHSERLMLAVVHPDSSIAYYIIHQGLVKPRQN